MLYVNACVEENRLGKQNMDAKFEDNGPNIIGGVGNYTLHGPDFYVSYNANTGTGFSMLSSLFAGDGDGEETALVKDNKYRILNGDWREEYARLVPQGWDACLAFFEAHRKEHGSSWTTEGV